MAQITLKRQAREFAEQHGVSYTRALAAVDEPLHRLKFELHNRTFARPGFELTDSEEDLLLSPDPSAPLSIADFTRRIRGTRARPFLRDRKAETEILFELARRTEILSESKAADIWEQRQLYRAGLSTENLEPVPSYYRRFGRAQDLILDWDGARLGFVEVAVLQDELREIHSRNESLVAPRQKGSFRLKKITLAELQDLLDPTGAKAAPLAETYICSKCGKEDSYENMVEHPYYEHGEQEEREDLPSWIRRI